jgi:diaminopimelate decarboxylase
VEVEGEHPDARVRLNPVTIDGGGLAVGGVPVAELVHEFGSPLFVMCAGTAARAADRLQGTLGAAGARLYFAAKANPNPFVWRWLRERGVGLDTCSPGETAQGLEAGFAPEEISFTGCALTRDDMDALASSGVEINLDAADQARAFAARHPEVPFGLRINPGQGAGSHEKCTTAGPHQKLGIAWEQVPGLVRQLREDGARVEGLHCHTGSGGLDAGHFVSVCEQMSELADELGDLRWLSLGGGIGVPHHPDDEPFDLPRYAAALREAVRPDRELRLEPGQAYVAQAGVLVMSVVSVKEQSGGTRFALCDSSYNHYLGTSAYQSYHVIEADLAEVERSARPRLGQYVVGHLCNTGDVFARDRKLPELEVGDRLVMLTCGAYGLSRAANYNSRPIPAEVWVEGGQARVIRRRQSLADLSRWYEG